MSETELRGPASRGPIARLRDQVLAHRPSDAIEEQHRRLVAELIDSYGDEITLRSCRPGHLTGSALVLDAARRRVLLLEHAKLRIWVQPGGHADGDADLRSVALREASEETGIEGLVVEPDLVDIDVHEVRPPSEDPHRHLDLRFVVVAPPDAVVSLNHESRAFRWVDGDEARSLNPEPGLARLIRKGLSHPSE